MLFSHIFIALIPFFLVGAVGILISTKEEEKNVMQHTAQMVGQVQQTVDIYVNSIEKTVNMLIETIHYKELNSQELQTEQQWEKHKKELEQSLKTVSDTHDEIAGVFFATEKGFYASTGMSRVSRDPFLLGSWYQEAAARPEEMQILSDTTGRNIMTDATYSIDDVFSVAKAVADPKTGEIIGVILLDIKHDIISSAIQGASTGNERFVFVLDSQENMVYAPTNQVVYRINPQWPSDEDTPVTARINGEKFQIRYQQSEYTGWKFVSVASFQEIMHGTNVMLVIFGTVLIITLFIVLLVAFQLSKTITQPIVGLAHLMKETEKGDLSVRFQGDYQDEVSELGRKFNHMLERIQKLLDAVYQEQEKKRKAQLKVVQEQFKPHFLYNTLDTIGWMAREHKAYDIVHLVDALTNVFRVSLSRGKDYITIEEELRYISNYLYIQKIRYGSKVLYEVQTDEESKKVYVPKLILQPLVENAIYHGVKMKRGEGHLKISVQRRGEDVLMEVEDDGRGMDAEKVRQLTDLLNKPSESEQNQSFGLFYVKERLRIRYGEKFQVTVASEKEKGTKVSVIVPAEYQEEGKGGQDEKKI